MYLNKSVDGCAGGHVVDGTDFQGEASKDER